eukprot:5292608-Pyramimonas_sp.AAC.1
MERHIKQLVEMNKEMADKVKEGTNRAMTAEAAGQEQYNEYAQKVMELRRTLEQQQRGQQGKHKQMQDTTIQACAQMKKMLE